MLRLGYAKKPKKQLLLPYIQKQGQEGKIKKIPIQEAIFKVEISIQGTNYIQAFYRSFLFITGLLTYLISYTLNFILEVLNESNELSAGA